MPIVQHKRGSAEAAADPLGLGFGPASSVGAVQRSVSDDLIDAPREESISEDRATIQDGPADLSATQLDKAQRRNPHWAHRLGFTPADFGSAAAVESAEFAGAVAAFQREHGLAVDGIAGPKTHKASGAGSEQLEPGVLGPDDELAPGLLGEGDQLEPGVLGGADELERGVLGPADELEPGVLGAGEDQLESGLVGMGDPMLSGGAASGDSDVLESGVLGSVQGMELPAGEPADIHAAAAHGVAGATQALPYREKIEASTGAELGSVRAVVGGRGAEATAAMGAEAYATGENVVFAAEPSLHTAAHEATHVLQQRQGVQLLGGVGEVGDRYEQQADNVADKVVAGESARDLLGTIGRGTTSNGAGSVQRFGAREHRDVGNEATNSEVLKEFAAFNKEYAKNGLHMTFGDMVMLAADLFGNVDEIRGHMKTKEGRARVAWARWWTSGKKGEEPAVDEAVKKEVDARYKQLATQNAPHFSAGGTAGTAYGKAHGRALEKAFSAGIGMGGTLDEAVTDEAFSHHYLSDMFASGHVRTPREEIKSSYDDVLPGGLDRFIAYMAHEVVGFMKQRAAAYAAKNFARTGETPSLLWRSELVLYEMASQVAAEVRTIGGSMLDSASVADVVALAHHNDDNQGLGVVSERDPSGKKVSGGFKWHAVGDSALNSPNKNDPKQLAGAKITRKMVLAAMRASRKELDDAYAEGRRQGSEGSSPSWTQPEFAALGFIPKEDPDAGNTKLEWEWGKWNDDMKNALDEAIRHEIVPQLLAVAPGTWTWAGPDLKDADGKTKKRDLVHDGSKLDGEVRHVGPMRLEVGAAFFDFAMKLEREGHKALIAAMATPAIPEVPKPARPAEEASEPVAGQGEQSDDSARG